MCLRTRYLVCLRTRYLVCLCIRHIVCLSIRHLVCLRTRYLVCLRTRYLVCLRTRYLVCLCIRHLVCLRARHLVSPHQTLIVSLYSAQRHNSRPATATQCSPVGLTRRTVPRTVQTGHYDVCPTPGCDHLRLNQGFPLVLYHCSCSLLLLLQVPPPLNLPGRVAYLPGGCVMWNAFRITAQSVSPVTYTAWLHWRGGQRYQV